MQASKGDQLLVHGRVVGQEDKVAQIVEVLGHDGNPPFRVRFEDGHEAVMSPGPDSVVRHEKSGR
ncbi:DUF1918 domain-containing protein [Streptomyces odontomachi]|uniref:DUF1918 domain-containing protein n=1 Tax=Streptomyces odontomachi TaxID=2944940 RepID=UPI00210F1883|nr:DUF1918 domain-containing protein [Streptomyces sp. ODS25]